MRPLLTALVLTFLLSCSAGAAALTLDGQPMEAAQRVVNHTTYVSLRAVVEALCPGAWVRWEEDQAMADAPGLTLTARPGEQILEANDRAFYLPDGVLLDQGVTLVPVRPLAAALGAEVEWDPAAGAVHLRSGSGPLPTGRDTYPDDLLLWLSRIISAESQGEPLAGKIAVGNVVLNRVASPDFPGTVYSVIFDDRWGGQFEPVRNGTIYLDPTPESILAAKMVLEGADVAGPSLYFLAPHLTSNHWIMENRDFVMTIGVHWFYQ